MITKSKYLLLAVVLAVFSASVIHSQNSDDKKVNEKLFKKLRFFDLRGTNAVDLGIGSSIANGDLPDPEFEIYFKIGYKHHITSHLNFNVSYNKYSLAFREVYNEGFMSFDFNLEYLPSPYRRFTPFLFAGGGYNAANYFESTSNKAQGGLGFECIAIEGLGIRLFGEYNYFFSDELDGLIIGNSDDAVWRFGLGVNFYFGGKKRKEKLLSRINTVINSNPIVPNN